MNLLSKISAREKKFIVMGGVIIIAVVLFEGYTWYQELRKRADDLSQARAVMLEKQLDRISGKESFEKRFEGLKQELAAQEKAILQGDKPPIAAAALSRVLREAASTQGINIGLERTLNPSEIHSYIAVPVEIGFTTTTEKLKELLYRLRISPFLLTVSEIKIRVTNITKPTDIYTSMVVTGYIKRPGEQGAGEKEKDKEKEVKKEAKDAT